MAKGPLNKDEKKYIEKHYLGESAKDIAEHLGRSKATIKRYAEKFHAERQTAGYQMKRPAKGVVMMTEEASTRADDQRTPTRDIYNSPRVRRAKKQ